MRETEFWGFTEGKELFVKTLREIRFGGYKFVVTHRNNPIKVVNRPTYMKRFYNKYCRNVYNKKRIYSFRKIRNSNFKV